VSKADVDRPIRLIQINTARGKIANGDHMMTIADAQGHYLPGLVPSLPKCATQPYTPRDNGLPDGNTGDTELYGKTLCRKLFSGFVNPALVPAPHQVAARFCSHAKVF
jgi:hypothetical protein